RPMTLSEEAKSAGQDWEAFFSHYTTQIQRRQVALFVGAGLSSGAGLPSWSDLVWTLAKHELPELETTQDRDLPLPSIAQYFVNHDPLGRHRLHEYLHRELSSVKAIPTAAHRLIPTIGFDLIWTSNYDDLIEQTYSQPQRSDVLDVFVT